MQTKATYTKPLATIMPTNSDAPLLAGSPTISADLGNDANTKIKGNAEDTNDKDITPDAKGTTWWDSYGDFEW
jgi:hypothetical protein